MFSVVGKQRQAVAERDGGNCHIGVGGGGKRVSLLSSVAAEQPGLSGDSGGDGEELQAVEKLLGVVFFPGPETGVHLSEVYRATGEHVPLFDQIVQVFGAPKASVKVVKNDRRCRGE